MINKFVHAYYQPVEDLYIIEFNDPATFPPQSQVAHSSKFQWSMFAHGVCSPIVNGSFTVVHKIAFTGWHLPESPELIEEGLRYRIELATSRLVYMAFEATEKGDPNNTPSLFVIHAREAARILKQDIDFIVNDLIASRNLYVASVADSQGPV